MENSRVSRSTYREDVEEEIQRAVQQLTIAAADGDWRFVQRVLNPSVLDPVGLLRFIVLGGSRAEQVLETINAHEEEKWAPLHAAAAGGHVKVLEILLGAGSPVNMRTPDKETALIVAARRSHLEAARLLLRHQADVRAHSQKKHTALQWASANGMNALVEMLLERGALVDAQDAEKETPLHWASLVGAQKTVEVLVEWGANLHIRNNRGERALDIAERASFQEVIAILTAAEDEERAHSLLDTSARDSSQQQKQVRPLDAPSAFESVVHAAMWCTRAVAEDDPEDFIKVSNEKDDQHPDIYRLRQLQIAHADEAMVVFRDEERDMAVVAFRSVREITNKQAFDQDRMFSRHTAPNVHLLKKMEKHAAGRRAQTARAAVGRASSRPFSAAFARPTSASLGRPRPASAPVPVGGRCAEEPSISFTDRYSLPERRPQGGPVPCKERLLDNQLARPTSLKGAVHHGALLLAKKATCTRIQYLLARHESVVLTGHCLGGAAAALVAAQLVLNNPSYMPGLQVCTFGAPLLGDTQFCQSLEAVPGAQDRFHHFVCGKDLVPRAMLLRAHLARAAGLADAAADAYEAMVTRAPAHQQMGVWAAVAAKLELPRKDEAPFSAALSAHYSEAGESPFRAFGTFYFLPCQRGQRGAAGTEVVRLQDPKAVEAYLKDSAPVAAPNMLLHHTLPSYQRALASGAALDFAHDTSRAVLRAELERLDHDNQRLMDLQKLSSLLRFNEEAALEEVMENIEEGVHDCLMEAGPLSDELLISVLEAVEQLSTDHAAAATSLSVAAEESKAWTPTTNSALEDEVLDLSDSSLIPVELLAEADVDERARAACLGNFEHIQLKDLRRTVHLGSGALGEVWAAECAHACASVFTGPVAAKAFRNDLSKRSEVGVALELLAKLKHPRLVRFLGGCAHDPRRGVLVSELMQGNLHDAVFTNKLPQARWEQRGRALAVQVAEGLAHLHSQRVAHRRLTARNVLLTSDWDCKIADVAHAPLAQALRQGKKRGVPSTRYDAPELHAAREVHEFEMCDVWSLGILLWELFTQTTAPCQLVDPQGQVSLAFMPMQLRSLIVRCLSHDPEARPAAREVVLELAAVPECAGRAPPEASRVASRPRSALPAYVNAGGDAFHIDPNQVSLRNLHASAVSLSNLASEPVKAAGRPRSAPAGHPGVPKTNSVKNKNKVAPVPFPETPPDCTSSKQEEAARISMPSNQGDSPTRAPLEPARLETRPTSATRSSRSHGHASTSGRRKSISKHQSKRNSGSWIDEVSARHFVRQPITGPRDLEDSDERFAEHGVATSRGRSKPTIDLWDSKATSAWIVSELRFPQYESMFKGMDGSLLMELSDEDLTGIGITNSHHRRSLLREIAKEKAFLVLIA